MRCFTFSLLVVFAGLLSLPSTAPADVVLLFQEVGADVELSASGSFDTTGASKLTGSTSGGLIIPTGARVNSGVPVGSSVDYYLGTQGVTSFGSGGLALATSGTGDNLGGFFISGNYRIITPLGYVSGTAFSSSSTFSGQTNASLGLTAGDYLLGTLPSGSTLSLRVQASAVPEPTSLLLVSLSIAGFGFVSQRRRRR